MRTIAEDLRAWRLERGLSQVQLSERVGITQPRISVLETGRVLPTSTQVVRLGRFYGRDIGSLAVRLAEELEARQARQAQAAK